MKARADISGQLLENEELRDAAEVAIYKIRGVSDLLVSASEGSSELSMYTVGAADMIICDNLDALKGIVECLHENGGANGNGRDQASRNNRKATA